MGNRTNDLSMRQTTFPQMMTYNVATVCVSSMEIIEMLLGGHHPWIQIKADPGIPIVYTGSMTVDLILLLPCRWLPINRLAADGGGSFRCDTGRDSEIAPLARMVCHQP